MSELHSAPPNGHTNDSEHAVKAHGSVPITAIYEAEETIDMAEYRQRVPLWKRVYQHSLTQMMLLSVQAFCGPAMADAIAGTFEISVRS